MPVTLISSLAELPADPSPGLFVLVQEEPVAGAVAATVAERLGSGPPWTPAEADEELKRRDVEAPAGEGGGEAAGEGAAAPAEQGDAPAGLPPRHAALERYREAASEPVGPASARQATLEQAREEAAEAVARVPARARRVEAGRLQSAAAAVRAAEEASAEARMLLGERPELPAEAAEAALAAEEAASRCRQQRTAGVDRSSAVLLGANALGILIVAARIRTEALDPVFVLVAVFPLAALLHLAATFLSNTRHARSATQLRAEALRAAGMATMAGLAARNARLKAWAARADALAAAEAALAHARRRWTALAGTSADAAQIDALLRTMARAERATAALAQLEADAEEAAPGLVPDPDPVPERVPDHETVPGLVPDPDPVPERDPDREALPGLEADLHRTRPLLVLIDAPADAPLDEEARKVLERWDEEGTPCPVVVVTACSEVGTWAEARTAGMGTQVVDLRERVLASLDRLRSRAATFGDPTPPGSMAADG